MRTAVIKNPAVNADIKTIKRLLFGRGHDLTLCAEVSPGQDFVPTLKFAAEGCEAIVVIGLTESFFSYVKDKYIFDEKQRLFVFEERFFALMDNFEEQFVTDEVIPMLNGRAKTYYSASVFRTFGLSEIELKELLKEQLKNKHRITFSFEQELLECRVALRYSNKADKQAVDKIIRASAERLKEVTYSVTDEPLVKTVSELLKIRKKKLGIAESFTGGNIAAMLVMQPGASEYLREGIVAYSNQAKIERLSVEPLIIERYGAVSIETVYEMAAGLLSDPECDVAIATTGNAGPTAEKEGQTGLCYIAVGDSKGIHIYEEHFSGSRAEVIEMGVKTALFMLYKKLTEDEFDRIIKGRENLPN